MTLNKNLNSTTIRSIIKPGDLGYVIHRHGAIYAEEYNYGVEFEMYVAEGLNEFYNKYDPLKDRVWICENGNIIIAFLLLMHRENNAAQLRYFYIEREYRGIGLGKKLMTLYMAYLKEKGYASSYLWTTKELDVAASLYTRFGFIIKEEKETAAFGKRVIEQRYELIF